jgi:UDP-N-acetylglucosamine 1-carboxyvinyltransferase
LKIHGRAKINQTVEYFISEDPIEAMSFIAAAVVTDSQLEIKRAPIEFLELELTILKNMGLEFNKSAEYPSKNGQTRLVDLTIKQSKLIAPADNLHAMPSPGVNQDNLPFLGLIATMAEGRTLLHDWAYENRAIYLTELNRLGADIELVDPHRVYITGPTNWKAADITAPPALRPSVVRMLAMLAAPGQSMLRDVYNIKRGYQDLPQRLNAIGADIQTNNEL